MLQFDIIAVIPELLEGPFRHSILQRAEERGLLQVRIHDLRTFGEGKHHQIDDYQYGGGAGMVLMPGPLSQCLDALLAEGPADDIIYLTPDGETLNQKKANQWSLGRRLILICGHYKGIDERIRQQYVTSELSIGDYVLSGGELAAAIVVDAVGRLIPGALNDGTSALTDSFQDGLLAPPVYTRPASFKGLDVPDILLSGNQGAIDTWRHEQAQQRTAQRRPDLWKKLGED